MSAWDSERWLRSDALPSTHSISSSGGVLLYDPISSGNPPCKGRGGTFTPIFQRERNAGTESTQGPVQWHWIQGHVSVSPDLLLMNQEGSVTSYAQVQLRNICRVTRFINSVKKGEKGQMKRQGSKGTRREKERRCDGHVRQEHRS